MTQTSTVGLQTRWKISNSNFSLMQVGAYVSYLSFLALSTNLLELLELLCFSDESTHPQFNVVPYSYLANNLLLENTVGVTLYL